MSMSLLALNEQLNYKQEFIPNHHQWQKTFFFKKSEKIKLKEQSAASLGNLRAIEGSLFSIQGHKVQSNMRILFLQLAKYHREHAVHNWDLKPHCTLKHLKQNLVNLGVTWLLGEPEGLSHQRLKAVLVVGSSSAYSWLGVLKPPSITSVDVWRKIRVGEAQ